MTDKATSSYPSLIPNRKPTDRPLSAATQRMFDVWDPHEDRGNPLYSNFKYSALEGLEEPATSRICTSNCSLGVPFLYCHGRSLGSFLVIPGNS